jgi:predicted 2-oxoglutarate/Fe(II)-dependent dioxygenase YbiX
MMRKQIQDYIMVTNCLPSALCEEVVKNSAALNWRQHGWYDPSTNATSSEETKELYIAESSQELQDLLASYVVPVVAGYADAHNDKRFEKTSGIFVNTMTPYRFNRYHPGTMMRPHFDHIHSAFDGQQKGVPILSIVGVLNDDYKGGEFVFFGDTHVPLRTGDVLIFPSNFMYVHEVREVTEGTRHSFVSWAF